MGPTGNTRIVQIHPTRKCNLSCKHCYSSSSPQATDTLEPSILKYALDDLVAEGYEWVSFSGGEPLVYEPLPEILDYAQQINMHTTLVTNGMLLAGARLDAIEFNNNGLVLSLDGTPESHNHMRNSPRAFESMEKNLSELRRRSMKFAFLFTLTQHNLDELPWVAEFCEKAGATGLIVHPLEAIGNASSQLQGKSPDSLESAYAWRLVEQLKNTYKGRFNINLNMVHTSVIDENPDAFFLGNYPTPLRGSLSDLLSGIVIEPDGEVVPLQYGFPREYSLGNLRNMRISEMVDRWRNHVGPRLIKLCADFHTTLDKEPERLFINWYERLDSYARQNRTLPFPAWKEANNAISIGAI